MKFYAAEPREYLTVEENGWQPDVDDMRKRIDERTKAIALINPNNPTGGRSTRRRRLRRYSIWPASTACR